jgi:hypothetical protein
MLVTKTTANANVMNTQIHLHLSPIQVVNIILNSFRGVSHLKGFRVHNFYVEPPSDNFHCQHILSFFSVLDIGCYSKCGRGEEIEVEAKLDVE